MVNTNPATVLKKAITSVTDEFSASDERVYLSVDEHGPPVNRGQMVDVSYRIKNHHYNSFLFRFILGYEGTVIVQWGDEEFEFGVREVESLKAKVREITNSTAVRASREQLLELAGDGSKKGFVYIEDYGHVCTKTFEIEVSPDQIAKFEHHCNDGEDSEFRATQPEVSPYPGKFRQDLEDKRVYRYLEIQGWRALIDKIVQDGDELVLSVVSDNGRF